MDIDSILSDSHRKRALLKKRMAEARKRRRPTHLSYHLRRVACEIRMAGLAVGATAVSDGFVVGPDLSYSQLFVFSRRSFAESQSIEVTLDLGSRPQYLTGYVKSIREVSRLGARLYRLEVVLDSPSGARERASFMEFLNEFHRKTMWSDRF